MKKTIGEMTHAEQLHMLIRAMPSPVGVLLVDAVLEEKRNQWEAVKAVREVARRMVPRKRGKRRI